MMQRIIVWTACLLVALAGHAAAQTNGGAYAGPGRYGFEQQQEAMQPRTSEEQRGSLTIEETITPLDTTHADVKLTLREANGGSFEFELRKLHDPEYAKAKRAEYEASEVAQQYRRELKAYEREVEFVPATDLTPSAVKALTHGLYLDILAGDTSAPMRFADRFAPVGGYKQMQTSQQCTDAFQSQLEWARQRVMRCFRDAGMLPWSTLYYQAPYQMDCMLEYGMVISGIYSQWARCVAFSIPRVG